MRALFQRVTRGAVRVDGAVVGEIGAGAVVLLGVRKGDNDEDAAFLARKVANLRVFPDDAGKLNRSVIEVGGAVLSVSQFTLYGDAHGGNRPSFIAAAAPDEANRLYEVFNAGLAALGVPMARGQFRRMMQVEIHNDGPVTIWLDTEELRT
ncbi:MAG: D-tyrosyl-tRNA(Tyr) deacylase [Armatimonadetes bacterium]|nr:D-tyrosyl-tRNA(Tyr) deacylase [Armatimonadota bacterium]